jgi:hypothetical protein
MLEPQQHDADPVLGFGIVANPYSFYTDTE